MKKLVSLLICICLICSSSEIFAQDVYIELDSLQYDEYMRGETIFISGQTNAYVTLGLYYPESYGSTAKYIMTYSPSELADGIELETDTDDKLWPDGVWTIIVQSGEVSESLEFTLCEVVDRSEDEPSKPTGGNNKPTGGDVIQVTPIIPEKTDVTVTKGKTETVKIDTTSSLKVEIEDEEIIDASLSGNTLTITALQRGNSDIWLRSSNNYVTIHVTVKASTGGTGSGEEPTQKPTEPPTEAPTEETTEVPTQEPTEEPTEAPTENDTAIENPFTDVPDSHWAKDSILSLYAKGIINGMDADTFAPDDSVTRAQFVTMLCKAFDYKMKSANSPFNDVTEDDWFFTSVMAAYNNAIAQGDYAGNFNPNNFVTRQDMATLAYRAATNKGINLSVTNIVLFTDNNLISDYAAESVYAMRSAGIINGMTDTTFEPLGTATRAQAAHIIAKLLALD